MASNPDNTTVLSQIRLIDVAFVTEECALPMLIMTMPPGQSEDSCAQTATQASDS